MNRQGLLLIAHGSKDPQWSAPFLSMAEQVRQHYAGPCVLAYLESASPSLEEGVAQLRQQGAHQLVVAPLLLASGQHLNVDLPQRLRALGAQLPDMAFRVLPAVGLLPSVQQHIAQEVLAQAMAETQVQVPPQVQVQVQTALTVEAQSENQVAVFDVHGQTTQALVPEVCIDPEAFYARQAAQTSPDSRQALTAYLQYPAVAIVFGKCTEGRPYTLAARLREAGYAGEIHAVGAFTAEVLHHLVRVGFTHFHLPATTASIDAQIIAPFTHTYQAPTKPL